MSPSQQRCGPGFARGRARRVQHGAINGIIDVACTCGVNQQCLGDLRVFGRRALGCDEKRDFDCEGERVDCMATTRRVDEDSVGGEACDKGEKAAQGGRHVVDDA